MGVTTEYVWRLPAGARDEITFPILESDESSASVLGWDVDAKVRQYPGGPVLYTFPVELAHVVSGGTRVRLTLPAPITAAFRFSCGWWRVVVSDPASDVADPSASRVIQGLLVLDPS